MSGTMYVKTILSRKLKTLEIHRFSIKGLLYSQIFILADEINGRNELHPVAPLHVIINVRYRYSHLEFQINKRHRPHCHYQEVHDYDAKCQCKQGKEDQRSP